LHLPVRLRHSRSVFVTRRRRGAIPPQQAAFLAGGILPDPDGQLHDLARSPCASHTEQTNGYSWILDFAPCVDLNRPQGRTTSRGSAFLSVHPPGLMRSIPVPSQQGCSSVGNHCLGAINYRVRNGLPLTEHQWRHVRDHGFHPWIRPLRRLRSVDGSPPPLNVGVPLNDGRSLYTTPDGARRAVHDRPIGPQSDGLPCFKTSPRLGVSSTVFGKRNGRQGSWGRYLMGIELRRCAGLVAVQRHHPEHDAACKRHQRQLRSGRRPEEPAARRRVRHRSANLSCGQPPMVTTWDTSERHRLGVR